MLFLAESDVRSLLPMKKAIELMRLAFEAFAKGDAQNQPRRRLHLSTGAALHSMAGAYGGYFGTKIYSAHAQYGAYFLFVLYDAATARPLAMMEANYLGQIRTGAASGFATELLSRRESRTLGIIGSGFQARGQLAAIRAVRELEEVRVWSRDRPKRERFAQEAASVTGLNVRAVDSGEQAVRDADIIATATFSKNPVLENDWVAPGAHINAMGSNHAQKRELPGDLVSRADLIVVDSIDQARMEAGDLILGLDEAGWSGLVELRDLAVKPIERAGDAITIFKSLGLGLEDVAAGSWIYEEAVTKGVGTQEAFFTPELRPEDRNHATR